MEYLYTPQFGEQFHFAKGPADAELVANNKFFKFGKKRLLQWYAEDQAWRIIENMNFVYTFFAGRTVQKITQEADCIQQAIELPEIGSKCVFWFNPHYSYYRHVQAEWLDGDILDVLAHVDNGEGVQCAVVYNSRLHDTVQLVAQSLKSLETAKERQVRARKEWCDKALQLFLHHKSDNVVNPMGEVFDAIVSGELKTPGEPT